MRLLTKLVFRAIETVLLMKLGVTLGCLVSVQVTQLDSVGMRKLNVVVLIPNRMVLRKNILVSKFRVTVRLVRELNPVYAVVLIGVVYEGSVAYAGVRVTLHLLNRKFSVTSRLFVVMNGTTQDMLATSVRRTCPF